MEIRNDVKLKSYIINEDLWNKATIETDGFENEIDEIFINEVTIGQCYKLYTALNGDNILDNKLFKKKAQDIDLHMRKESSISEKEIKPDSGLAKELDENNDGKEPNISTENNTGSDNDNSSVNEDSEEEDDFRDDEI